MNLDTYGKNLSLNVDDYDSSIDFDLGGSAAPYYGVSEKQAEKIVSEIKSIVSDNWRNAARKYGISRGE